MTDGVEIAVRRYAIGKGPCLVISHGNGFAIDGYRVFWEPLLDRFELVLFDVRNHGRNPRTSSNGHHYHQMAIDMGTLAQALRERLAPGQAMVGVFHSMSGRAAMKHATEMAWVWDALVLFDPPNMPPAGHRTYEAMRAFELRLVDYACNRPDHFESVDAMLKLLQESRATSRWQPQAIIDMAHAVLQADPAGGVRLACRRELEAMIYLAALSMDLWPAAAAFGGPVKLIGADPGVKNNPPTGIANQALAEEAGYRFEAIAETSHLLQIERPDACRESMVSFLREVGII
jgi:pimeloyl-ACP methyl ester carboxylesterase